MTAEFNSWLGNQYPWIQVAANRLLANGSLTDTDIDELVEIIKSSEEPVSYSLGSTTSNQVAPSASEVRLLSMGPIEGIDTLGPRLPLEFGDKNLVVVYGNNGSGKSGYVRILSKASAKPHARALKGNIFSTIPQRQMCRLCYSVNGEIQELDWTPDMAISDLSDVDIFDSYSGRLYLESETEVAYMPPVLALMADIVSACGRVEMALSFEERSLISGLPTLPAEFSSTTAGVAFRAINHNTSEQVIQRLTSWTEEHEEELTNLTQNLSTEDPFRAAHNWRLIHRKRNSLLTAIENAVDQLKGDRFREFSSKISDAEKKRRIAKEAALALSNKAILNGVGSETWRAMWYAARDFATTEALPDRVFPYVEQGSICVFCQQDLNEDARIRLKAFESYVNGELEAEASTAEGLLSGHMSQIPIDPTSAELEISGIESELQDSFVDHLGLVWDELGLKLKLLREGIMPTLVYEPSSNVIQAFTTLRFLVDQANTKANSYEHLMNPEVLASNRSRKLELLAKKWVGSHSNEIIAELNRLKRIQRYSDWKRQTTTTGISRRAGDFSQTLITEAYVGRFNDELLSLGADGISVKLVKTRTDRGKVKHLIQFATTVSSQAQLTDILSEGERRIISLAAFIADMTGRIGSTPFVFDDPISSLDQTWEERTIDRLIALSHSRQVIVFTHRLSLLGIITEKADDLNTIHIRKESWGTGEPVEVPLNAKRPVSALNDLKTRRLSQARRAREDSGSDTYNILAKSICSDFRILLERFVEIVLLADIVQRHRRSVNTLGKIQKLAKITSFDCSLIDSLMTKYSRYEHSQSNESPVELPNPDEIQADIDSLLEWNIEFTART